MNERRFLSLDPNYARRPSDRMVEGESVVMPDDSTHGSNVLGYYGLTRQYHERYGLPVMHTEPTVSRA